MENPIKMDDLGKTHYFQKHPGWQIICGLWIFPLFCLSDFGSLLW